MIAFDLAMANVDQVMANHVPTVMPHFAVGAAFLLPIVSPRSPGSKVNGEQEV